MPDDFAVFFATDLHGSDACFRKLLSLLGRKVKLKKQPDAIVLGGDFICPSLPQRPDVLVHVVKVSDGTYETRYRGQSVVLRNEPELRTFCQTLAATGSYFNVCTTDELYELSEHPKKFNALLLRLQFERARTWVELADRKFGNLHRSIFVTPGHNDPPGIEEVFKASRVFVYCDEQVLQIGGGITLLSVGHSIYTSRHGYREQPEDVLHDTLWSLAEQVPDMGRCAVHTHCPPYGTALDLGYEVDPTTGEAHLDISGAKQQHVGSQAVREFILHFKPLLGLHGFVHPVFAYSRLGTTICFNPGTEYYVPRLRGAYLVLDNGRLTSWSLTVEDPAGDHARTTQTDNYLWAVLEKVPILGIPLKLLHQDRKSVLEKDNAELRLKEIKRLESDVLAKLNSQQAEIQAQQSDIQVLLRMVEDLQRRQGDIPPEPPETVTQQRKEPK